MLAQRREQALIQRFFRQINSTGRRAIRVDEDLEDLKNKVEERRRLHENLASANSSYFLFSFFYILALFAAYAIDVSLYSAAAEYFASFTVSSTIVRNIVKFLFPAAILAVDIWISLLISSSQESALFNGEFGKEKYRVFVWRLTGGFWAVSITILAVVTSVASQEMSDFSPLISWGIRIVLFLFALLLHYAIIFSGGPATQAKEYIMFQYQDRRDERRIRRLEERYEGAVQDTINVFEMYYQRLNEYNSRYQPPLEAGPIQTSVRELINKRCGNVVIEAPSEGTNPAPQQSDEDGDSLFTPTDSDWDPFDDRR